MLTILADIADQSALQTGATLLTVLMALVSSFFSWLSNRDRLKFDVRMNELITTEKAHKESIARLQSDAKACQKDRDLLSQKLDKERTDREQQGREFNQQLMELRNRQ